MSVKITDTEMTSDITIHTAKLWPFKGDPPSWSVTWLPGRVLTYNQVITAMTIAETVAEHAENLAARGDWQVHVDGWAAELGITGPIAIAEAIKPRISSQLSDAGRNRDGEICPSWCTADHDEELIPGNPNHGYMSTHRSDPVHRRELGGAEVVLVQPSGSGVPLVSLTGDYGRVHLEFNARETRLLAAVILDPVNDISRLASEMSVAADMLSQVAMRAAR